MAPYTDAMITKEIASLSPDDTVGDALKIFKEKNIRNMPVMDADGTFLGLFGLKEVLQNILPKAVNMGKGIPNMDFIVGGAENVAKKLHKSHAHRVGDIMNKNPKTIEPDSATWEALRIMVMHGSPVPVVEEKTNKFIGLISRQTLLAELENIMVDVEKERAERGQAEDEQQSA